jgi:hypothetical protein
MRALLFVMAAVFILGGGAIIANPKPSLVSHQGYRYGKGTTEVVPTDRSVVYGMISLGFGALALYAAVSWKKISAN